MKESTEGRLEIALQEKKVYSRSYCESNNRRDKVRKTYDDILENNNGTGAWRGI